MQALPEKWADIFASPHTTEYKVDIAGIEYYSDHIMQSPTITKPLLEKPTIGRVCSATFSVTILPFDGVIIPKAARVLAYCRLKDEAGNTTGWLPQGRYYVSSRSGNQSTISLTCRDDMLKGGVSYIDKSQLDWPASHEDVVKEICSLMDVELDERTSLASGSAYMIDAINGDDLMTEVLAKIAACNGGNWIMTESGKLRLIPFQSPSKQPVQELAEAYNGYTSTGDTVTISRVTMKDSGGTEYTAGDDSGTELYIECAYACQAIVADLCNTQDGKLYGATYQPYSVDRLYLDPACELGDTITINSRLGVKTYVVLHAITVTCNVDFTSAAASGIENESEDEYPYQTAKELADARSVKTNQSYYGNTINREYGFKSMLENGAFGLFNGDGIQFVDESGKKCFYYDMDAKTFVIDGTLGANAIFTNSMYAERGDVSELRVDQLSTAKHIKKFLKKDTSDDNYILIKDYSMQFISSTPAGLYARVLAEDEAKIITEDSRILDCEAGGSTSYEQAKNRYGDLLYWEKDISEATIDDEGYPYIDGVQVFATTTKTDFPVHIYAYEETIKAEYKFKEDKDGSYAPVQIWGSGSGYGDNGKGFIEKLTDMFKIGYTTRSGVEESLELNDDGWIDINKTRKPVSFDFSKISDGSFTETIDGGYTATYKVEFDSSGRISRIKDEQGHITEVHW